MAGSLYVGKNRTLLIQCNKKNREICSRVLYVIFVIVFDTAVVLKYYHQ